MLNQGVGRWLVVGFIGVVAQLAASCGPKSSHSGGDDDAIGGSSGSGGSTSMTAPVDENGFAHRYASSFCESIGACCQRGNYTYSRAACEGALEPQLDALVKVYLASGKVAYDDAAAARCIDSISASLRACTDHDLYRTRNEACHEIFKGTVALGGACAEDDECAPNGDLAVQCASGVCATSDDPFDAPSKNVKLGEPCGWTCQDNNGGSACYGVQGASGERPSNDMCSSLDGVYCDASSLTCVPLPAIGAACASEYGYCPTAAYCQANVCVARIESGACPTGNECAETAYCDYDGTQQCIKRSANGTACDSYNDCLSGSCEGDVCREWLAVDAAACAGVLDD